METSAAMTIVNGMASLFVVALGAGLVAIVVLYPDVNTITLPQVSELSA
ncbi:MAG: hypothetical protein ACPHUF_02330 [Gammaproteobacteria bacterium]